MEFQPYPKTPRFKRDLVITEKIDGTNAQIVITRGSMLEMGSDLDVVVVGPQADDEGNRLLMRVGSRQRWITPGKQTDNYGFAQWCVENQEELFKLGEGQHFGEWYGQGIQRGYGLDHRRFALFNTARWGSHNPNTPSCCHVVPLLGVVAPSAVDSVLSELAFDGSYAVPGFMRPEGIIAYHSASKQNFKVLLENDDKPKGE
jgi:hypothetical protein